MLSSTNSPAAVSLWLLGSVAIAALLCGCFESSTETELSNGEDVKPTIAVLEAIDGASGSDFARAKAVYSELRKLPDDRERADELWGELNLRRMAAAIKMDADPKASAEHSWELIHSAVEEIERVEGLPERVIKNAQQSLHDFYAARSLRWSLMDDDAAVLWRLRSLSVHADDERSRRLAGDLYGIRNLKVTVAHDFGRRLRPESRRSSAEAGTLAISPDGRILATGYGKARENLGEARLWDVATGEPLGQPLRHDGPIRSVTFSPDGRRLATCSRDHTARLWDVDTCKPKCAPLKHDDMVWDVVFSPDGRTLASCSSDKTVRLWDSVTGRPRFEPLHHRDRVRALSFSRDGRTLAAACGDYTKHRGEARLWDTLSGQPHESRYEHRNSVDVVSFSPDGRTVATGSWDGTAQLWSPAGERRHGEALRHGARVGCVVFSPDGQTLATGGQDGRTVLWNVASGQQRGEPLAQGISQKSVHFSPDSRTVATSSRLWNAETGQPFGEMLKNGEVSTVAFSPTGDTVATGSRHDSARLWSVDRTQSEPPLIRHEPDIYATAVSPDGTIVAIGSNRGGISLYNLQSGQRSGESLTFGRALAFAFSPDGRLLAAAGYSEYAMMWDVKTGESRSMPLRHEGPVYAVSFSRDGSRLATTSYDHTAQMWDVETGQAVGRPMKHDNSVWAVSFSPDGQTLATGSIDKMARLWDVATGQLRGSPLKVGGWVKAVVISPDGRTLATLSTATSGGSVQLWDVETGQTRGERIRLGSNVLAMEFSPDGSHLLSATYDGCQFRFRVDDGLKIVGSRRLNGQFPWAGQFRCVDERGERVQVPVLPVSNSLNIQTIDFTEATDLEPLNGDPEQLMREWEKKLGLRIDESTGAVVPLHELP